MDNTVVPNPLPEEHSLRLTLGTSVIYLAALPAIINDSPIFKNLRAALPLR